MSKKNRKNNKNINKKEKESDSRGSSTGVGSNSNNNHIHNNNILIPTVVDETVVATTTTTVLTQQILEHIDNTYQLAGYPKSHIFTVGYGLMKAKHFDVAIDTFKRGAENDGCVPCMLLYVCLQLQQFNNIHLVVPWALECSIRGNTRSMGVLMNNCYEKSKPITAPALSSFWMKFMVELGDTTFTEEMRKELKKNVANICCVCEKEDTAEKTFEKCGICKYYSYCGKDCQTNHWQEGNHMAECRQLKILHTCCKPHHVKEIKEAIIGGEDPKEIRTLQRLRTKLGLNRPKEEYEGLVLCLGDSDDSTIQYRYNYLTARKDGTVHIGSTPNVI